MPKFTIEHKSSKDVESSYSLLKKFLNDDTEIKKFDENLTCKFEDSNKTVSVKGSQFKAEFSIKPNSSGSQVSVLVDLPLLLTPFKGKVEEILKKKLSKHLA